MNDQPSLQHTLDPESKITLGNLSPERLSPNLFLGINLDHISMDKNTLALEWTNFMPLSSTAPSTAESNSSPGRDTPQTLRPSFLQSSDQSHHSLLLDATSTSSFDDIKFMNDMDSFKAECILNLNDSYHNHNQNIKEHSSGHLQHDQQPHHSHSHQHRMHYSNHSMDLDLNKPPPLMDLEKPIMNITIVENIVNGKF